MKVLYYDCFAGISGDMNLGVMIDLGIEEDYLIEELNKLSIKDEFELRISKGEKMGIAGTKVDVIIKNHHHDHNHHHTHEEKKTNKDNHYNEHEHHSHTHNHKENNHTHEHHNHRNLKDISKIIEKSQLNDKVKKISKEIFKIVAEAEAKVHGKTIEEVHFHEVGAVDSIVDIIGAAICYDKLGVDKVLSSTVELGGGFVNCAHGTMPVPAPATSEIAKDIPVHIGKINSETATPTGVAILKGTVDEYTDDLNFSIIKVGYGLGTKNFKIPNVLRAYLGEAEIETKDKKKVKNIMIETNIDDMTPEMLGYVEEKLFRIGALDVYRTSIIMKKGRLSTKLSILVDEEKETLIEEVLFKETTTLGLRKYSVEKIEMKRDFVNIETKYGEIPIKLGIENNKIIKYKPEYDEVKNIAEEKNVPIIEIYDEINKYDINKIWRNKNDE